MLFCCRKCNDWEVLSGSQGIVALIGLGIRLFASVLYLCTDLLSVTSVWAMAYG